MSQKNIITSISNNCPAASFLSASCIQNMEISGSYAINQMEPFLLILSQKGSGQIITSKTQRTLLPDNCIYFCRLEENTTLRPTSPVWHVIMLFIEGSFCDFYLSQFQSIFNTPHILSSGSIIRQSIYKLLTTSHVTKDTADILRFKLLTDIFTEITVQDEDFSTFNPSVPSHVHALKTALDTEYAYEFSLEKYEFILKVSKYRLCRDFSRCYQISPLKYLNYVRIEHAKNLLLTTDLTVKETGSSVGIHNTNHFINLFKRETGLTPQVFRQKNNSTIALLRYPYTPDVPL